MNTKCKAFLLVILINFIYLLQFKKKKKKLSFIIKKKNYLIPYDYNDTQYISAINKKCLENNFIGKRAV